MLAGSLLVLVTVLVVELLRRRRKRMQFFKDRGIPGPEPHLLWGHYREMRDDHYYWINKWTEEFGRTFGIFWGDKPFLVTTDLDVAKEVLVKQFPKFTNRAKLFGPEDFHPFENFSFLDEPKWRRIRSVVTPNFSSRKIKEMTPSVLKSIKGLENNLTKCSERNQAFDIFALIKRFTVDNVGRTAFGIDANTQAKPEMTSPLLKAAIHAGCDFMGGYRNLICNSFTSMNRILGPILGFLFRIRLLPHAINDLGDELKKVIEARKKGAPRNDLLQSILESQEVSTDSSALTARGDTEDDKKFSKTTSVKLTENQVVGTAISLFTAGYDTTSSALGFTLYLLGKYPDVQRRLREEIEEALADKDEPPYEVAMNLKYLDRVVRESLRLLPPVTGFTTRRALTDVDICGTNYPAGLAFYFPTKLFHIDPESWEAPLTFNPDRFLEPLKHPLAYQPFGDGPRNCVGMRAALLIIKLVLCNIVPKFEFKSIGDPKLKGVMVLLHPDRLMVTVDKILK